MLRSNQIILLEQTLQQLHNNWFDANTAHTFSSFAYRVEATRIMGMVLALNGSLNDVDDVQVETIDAHLSSLVMQLPVSQRAVYGTYRTFDEMRFQAQMITSL